MGLINGDTGLEVQLARAQVPRAGSGEQVLIHTRHTVGLGGWKQLPSPGQLRDAQLRPVLGSEKCL